MVFIVGASRLYQAIEKSPSWLKKKTQISTFARPGLSFNPNTVSPHENLQHLRLRGNFQRRKDLILWHVLSNSLSGHRSNNFAPQTVEQLLETLTFFGEHFRAIVYNRQIGNPDIFEKLRKAKVCSIISVKKHLLSKRKQKLTWFKDELRKVHPDVNIELNFLSIVFNHEQDLRQLTLKRSKSRKRKSKIKKKLKKQKKTGDGVWRHVSNIKVRHLFSEFFVSFSDQ